MLDEGLKALFQNNNFMPKKLHFNTWYKYVAIT